jgi:hypothetical protein
MTHLHPRVALSLKTVRRFGWINSGAQYSDQGMVGQRTYPAVSVDGKTAAALA